jgi:hypothetical protein
LVEEVGQGGRAGTMHALADEHLDRLQVYASVLAAVGKNLLGETAYFAGDFLLDGFESFFPVPIAGQAQRAASGRSGR